jgi:hypothetical protein
MFRLILLLLAAVALSSCSINSDKPVKEKSNEHVVLPNVDELNKTVWQDSKKVFDILNESIENGKYSKDMDFVEDYMKKYYESGYVDHENAETSLVSNIHALYIFFIGSTSFDGESQKESTESYKKTYAKLDQMFKDKGIE